MMHEELPSKGKITLRWLFDHVPVTYWISFGVFCISIFSAGFTVASWGPVSKWFSDFLKESDVEEQNIALKEENQRLLKQLSDQKQTSIENRKSVEKLVTRINALEKDNNGFEEENNLLRMEINSLKKELQRKKKQNGDSTSLSLAARPKSSDVKEIINALGNMFSSDVAEFLIEMVPRIKGGVSCDDFATMLGYAWSSERALARISHRRDRNPLLFMV